MTDPLHAEKKKQEGPRHNMLVVGEAGVYLSHLPMFMAPHNVQLILEATFTHGLNAVNETYFKHRQSHRGTRIYTLQPEVLDVKSLFAPGPHQSLRRRFQGTVFQGHLERGGRPIDTLTDVQIDIKRVVYSQQFGPGLDKSNHLEYILFGKGNELFLAHVIASPPDFDQILSVTIDNPPTPDELARGVRVSLLERKNSSSERIKEGENLQAPGHVAGAHQFLLLHLRAEVEFYLEEGELSSQM